MRKVLTLALVIIAASFGASAGTFAQTPQLGGVSGELVDAGGRALANERVELVQAGVAVQTATTGNRGEWSFAGVAAGDYVVRVSINGQTAGIRVTVAAGQPVAGALIVTPAAAAPSAALSRPALYTLLGAIAAAAITTGVVVAGS